MIQVRIGSNPWMPLSDAKESWINQQIQRHRADDVEPCVQVKINCDGVGIILSTPSCSSGGGGGRGPNEKEQAFFDLWGKLNLYDKSFTGGNVIAFLKQAEKLC